MTQLKLWVALSTLLVALFVAFGSVHVGRELGRREAIDRYREECLNAAKKNERQFTLLSGASREPVFGVQTLEREPERADAEGLAAQDSRDAPRSLH